MVLKSTFIVVNSNLCYIICGDIMNVKKMLNFWEEIDQLKYTKRYAANDKDAYLIDSPAAHSWRMTIIARDIIRASKVDLDPLYVIDMIQAHDISEYPFERDVAVTEIASGKVDKKQKLQRELDVFAKLREIGDTANYYDLFLEYECQLTDIAKFVKFIDKFEAMTHILARAKFFGIAVADADLVLRLCDKPVVEFPMLIPFVEEVKSQFKNYFVSQNSFWDLTWETSHFKQAPVKTKKEEGPN